MSRKSRSTGAEMNFDGLTDSVTNLVGALILLVVLIIGVTHQAVSQVVQPEPEKKEAAQGQAGQRPLVTLEDRVALLEGQIQAADQSVEAMKGKIKEAEAEFEELLKKVKDLEIPKPPPEKEPEPEKQRVARKVKFRPPLEKIEVNRQPTTFVIHEGTISHLDFKALNAALQKAIARKSGIVTVTAAIPDSVFALEGTVNVVDGRPSQPVNLQCVVVAGKKGESMAQFATEKSLCRRQISKLDPTESTVDFVVYPDSFDAFRQARSFAWERNLDVGWNPIESGKGLPLGQGAGVSATN